jgi:hypothetical protein
MPSRMCCPPGSLGAHRSRLALQLQRDRTMDAAAIDACIEGAVAQKTLDEEHARRAAWKIIENSAADFAARGLES